MPQPDFWSRIKSGRLIQVLAVYLGASWVLLQVVNELSDALSLPEWVGPVAVILLAIGLLIILATAWVQSTPGLVERARQEEVPHSWELDLSDAARAVVRGRLPHLNWARALAGGALAFLLLFGFAGVYVVIKDRGRSFLPAEAMADPAPHGIAVLPFHVTGESIRDWREGMVDLLSTGLDGAGGLRAIASPTVLARWSEAVPESQRNPPESVALDVAQRTGARYALLGQAVAIGPTVRITADVHELERGERLGQVQAEGHPDSVLTLVDRLAVQTIGLLSDRADGALPRIDIAAVTTSSLPAIKAFLAGEMLFRAGDFVPASEAYDAAVREDSLFALAHLRLSQSFGWGENINSVRAAESLSRAIELIDRLPDRERMIVRVAEAVRANDPDALQLADELTRKYPDDPEAWYYLGEVQLHVREALKGWDEAERSYERAVELAPGFAPYHIHLVEAAARAHADSALLRQRLDALEPLARGSRTVHRYRLVQQIAFGDSATRDSAFDEISRIQNQTDLIQILFGLSNPLFHPLVERFLHQGLERDLPGSTVPLRSNLVWRAAFNAGRIEEGLQRARHPDLPPQMLLEFQGVFRSMGFDVPTPELDAAIRDAAAGERIDAVVPIAISSGLLGNQAAHDTAVARLRADADSLLAAGDSADARRARAFARGLAAFPMIARGDLENAARLLETVRVEARNDAIRFWLGIVHRDLGNLRQAERYFRSFLTWDPDPFVSYELGKIYQTLGETDKARHHLEFFVLAWANAGPAARPMVEDAKRRLVELRVG